MAEPRIMVCPYCGHKATSTGIGAVHCGPHMMRGPHYHPAVRMVEQGCAICDDPTASVGIMLGQRVPLCARCALKEE